MSNVNQEMAKLYMEAIGLIIQLTNKLKYDADPSSALHIEAAEEFIKKNTFYIKGVEGLLK